MANGEVSLDFLINDEASGNVDKIVDNAVKGANKIDESATKSASKVREEAEKTRAELDKKFGKETRVKLTTHFDKAGVKNFDELLEKLPKEKQIELLTKANKGELIDVEKEIKALPPTVKSEIKLKDNASPEIKKVAALSKKDIHQKLVADADTHGIKNFDALLKKLPKKTQTQLLAKAEKGEVINYEKTLRKLPSKVITNVQLNDNASPSLHKLQNDAEKTQQKFSSFKQTMAGTFAGNAFFQGAQMVTAGIGGIMQELNESSKAWQTFKGNMHEFGKTDEEIKKVKGELQTFAQQSIYSASDMASTYSQLAAVGTKNTTELVKGFGGLSAAAEDPKQAMKTLSQQATQMAAKPKVAWEDFKLILEQSPAGMSAVAKQMGMSVGELTTKVQDGKVKTQDMFDAISKAGNSKSFSKMATSYKTVGEAVDGLKEGITNKLQPAFDGMSKVGIKAISGIANKFDNMNLNPVITMFKNFGKIAKPIIQGMVEPFQDMGKAIGGVAKHTGGLSGFNKVLGDIGKHKGALKVIGTLLGSVLTGIMAFKAIKSVTTAIKSVTTAFKLLKLAMISNPFGLIVVAVVAIGTALYELYKHNKKFKKFIDGIGKGIK
ncbi:tape measure protein, partial [Weissella viridescens]|uniref:tape measure protein n=2 Tax=Weissella TaxID=46255 RepID=UPI003AA896D7